MTLRHSYSSLKLHHQCPRAWAYKHLEGYEPLSNDDSLAALRGTAFHAVVAAALLQRGAASGTLLGHPPGLDIVSGVRVAIDWSARDAGGVNILPTVAPPDLGPEVPLTPYVILDLIEDWEKAQTEKLRLAMIAKYGDTLAARLRDLWVRYQLHWGEELDNWVPLLVEYEWNREAPNGRVLSGRVDAVVWNRRLGHVQVVDLKTHDSWPAEPEEVTELFDGQLQLGAWGLSPVLARQWESLPEYMDDPTPRSTCYDRVRFKKPTTPKLTQKGQLSKSVTDYDKYTYTNFCNSQEAQDAGYEYEEREWDQEAWFRRRQTPININIIRAHVLSYQDQIVKAEETQTETAIIIPSKDCGRCDFLELCVVELRAGKMVVEDHDLHLYGLYRKEPK